MLSGGLGERNKHAGDATGWHVDVKLGVFSGCDRENRAPGVSGGITDFKLWYLERRPSRIRNAIMKAPVFWQVGGLISNGRLLTVTI